MEASSVVLMYRYCLFVIVIVSNAIVCSAAAWNLPISQNAYLHAQLHIDIYMIFLGAFSLLAVIPILFIDVLLHGAFIGRVWVECLWVKFLWLLHFVGAILVTTKLPRDMCTPQARLINENSCVSVKLLMAFSWICTVNLFIYLIFLVIASVVHQKRDDTVWSSQVRSYPWYFNFYCHPLGSSPEIPVLRHDAPIEAPQPRRPILLLRRSMLSSLSRIGRRPERESGTTERYTRQSVTQQARPVSTLLTTLYPSHVQAALGPTIEPPPLFFPPRATHSQHFRNSRADSGGPPPLLNWPRPDIMSHPLPSRTAVRKVPASEHPYGQP
ncbi:hypothetical protein V8E52_005097 [Russula decolorans]